MADPEAPQSEPASVAEVSIDDESSDLADAESDFGPPFSAKTFGASFVWAKGEQYVATVLRVKEGENVVVSTANRKDMNVMLTGGRAVLEVDEGGETDRVELLPAAPVFIDPGKSYRLVAMTEVELFTVYSPMN
ncbi:MAG: hypothetical protein K1X88_30720 [Nannocystaceae bacterium]|nr:hypothetical protein [Nannocystaceae bacterium]